MTPQQLAQSDQRAAADREFGRVAFTVAAWFVGVMLVLGVYGFAAAAGWVPALPWSPLG